MSEFVTWQILASYGGALLMVSLITQFVKGLSFTKNIPTQVVSYILALIVLIPATFFTSGLTVNNLLLTLFNAIVVSLAANGGFSAAVKIAGKASDGELLIDTSNENKDVYRLDVGSIEGLATKKKITLNVKTGQIFGMNE